MVIRNSRQRKMFTAPPPRKAGTINGVYPLPRPSALHATKIGMIVTAPGISMLPMTSANVSLFKGKSSRANAYAARVEVRRTPKIDGSAMVKVLSMYRRDGKTDSVYG